MIYLYIAAAIAFAAVSGYAAIEHSRAGKFEAQVAERDARIESQNAAIATTKADGDRRVAEATKGVAKATKETQAARNEAERLRVATRAPSKPSACPAGDAVSEVRKGL